MTSEEIKRDINDLTKQRDDIEKRAEASVGLINDNIWLIQDYHCKHGDISKNLAGTGFCNICGKGNL